jgi:hypothetical protein
MRVGDAECPRRPVSLGRKQKGDYTVTWNHRKHVRHPILALAAIACAGLFAAAPASAGNEFRDGFEDQLGRLAAIEVFHLGELLVFGHHAPHVQYVPATQHTTYVTYEAHYPRHAIAKHRHHRDCRHRALHRGHRHGKGRRGRH